MWSIKHADISTPEFPASIIAGPESYSEAISFLDQDPLCRMRMRALT